MQKISTPVSNTDLQTKNELQPSQATIQQILQFAASYRSVQVNDNQQVGFNIN